MTHKNEGSFQYVPDSIANIHYRDLDDKVRAAIEKATACPEI